METDSLGEDSSTRDFWKKKEKEKEKEKEKQGRKEKKGKGARGKDDSARKASVNREGQETHQIGETLDSTCLITLTPRIGETNQPEQVNTSKHITPGEGEATLNSPDNTSDCGSELRAFKAFYDGLSDDSVPASPANNTEDVSMEGETSTNQGEESVQDAGTHHSDLSADITDLLNERETVERSATEQITEGSKQSDPDQIITHHTIQEGTPILTIEAFNDIVKGGRSESPSLVYSTDREFFKIKEDRFTRGMHKYDNGNGTYTINQPIAMAVALALETEGRNKLYLQALHESQKTHVEYVRQTAGFAKHIIEEVTKNVSTHLIENLNSPIEESVRQIENFTTTVVGKLEEHERCLVGQRDQRLVRGFLSRTREECESELLEAKLVMLEENNEDLKAQRDELKRTNTSNNEQINKLMNEKAAWQKRFMDLAATKRPREENEESVPSKRVTGERPDPSPAPSEDAEMTSLEGNLDAAHDPHTSSTLAHTSSTLAHTSNSSAHTSNTLARTANKSDTSRALPPPPWEDTQLPAEISDRRKERFKKDYNLDFDPWGPGLTMEDEAEVTLKMWKTEVKRSSRYVPDYCESKLAKHHITHDGNIKVGVKARDDFHRSTTTWGYHRKVEEQHEGYCKFQQRNYIPRTVNNYWTILNDPPRAAYERCIPVSLYYLEICKDSPGYVNPQQHIRASRDNSLHIRSSKDNSSHGRSSKDNSSHYKTPKDDTSQQSSSRIKLTSHKSTHHKSSSSSSRGRSAWHVATSADRRTSLNGPQKLDQDLATLVSWSNEDLSDDDRQYPHCPNLMALDDVAEINRLTDLVEDIRRGNPPSYYIALRESEVKNIRRVMVRRARSPSQEAFYTEDSGGNELESIFDANQIKLIQARINNIRGAALAQEEHNTNDGPGGQEVH